MAVNDAASGPAPRVMAREARRVRRRVQGLVTRGVSGLAMVIIPSVGRGWIDLSLANWAA
jgi:hypothetical protein